MSAANHLANEPSPYLQQHADNPVDWYPWGEEAFKKAKQEDKPIFLSIGYSTCHWCHVMAHESFEDSDVAGLMNDAFVNIKVDREERPDVDQVYMLVCQMLNGHGGWPLTIVMTPDKKPFFAATYIPKQQRQGHMGLMELIPKIKEMWQENRDKINNSADEINGHLKKVEQMPQGEGMDDETAKGAYQNLARKYDSIHGGFGQAPKFPSPHNITFMLRYGHLFDHDDAIKMASTTLKAMRLGGIFDHVGNGFHRYATDAQWLVPHFEKMLYDQAMLLHAYTEGWQVTGDSLFRQTAYEIVDYLKDRLTSPDGVFYSAEDADSEGEEGKFYVWSVDEIRQILDTQSAERVISVFNVTEEGNYQDEATGERTGKNILHLSSDLEEYADYAGHDPDEFKQLVNEDLKKLYQAREKRVRPHRDEKVLTDWNALMISALAKAARVFDDEEMKSMAGTAACFLLGNLKTNEGTLLHRYGNGKAAIEGHADDYAYLIWAMLECFETTQDPTYLKEATGLQTTFEKHFWDVKGGFYFTSDQGESLLIRNKEGFDGALPSANSVAMHNMVRLSRITGNMEYSERAEAIGKQFSQYGQKAPDGFTHMLQGILFGRHPGYEIILAGNSAEDELMNMYHAVASKYLPNSITLLLPNENAGNQRYDLENVAPYLEHYPQNHDQATAYVCRNYACEQPVHSVDELREML